MSLLDPISLSLPYPPSGNNQRAIFNGRLISSRAYRFWTKRALEDIAAVHERPTITGPYSLTIVARRPDRRRRDIANLEKCVSDSLVKAGVISDDCNAERITLMWSTEPPDRSARVIVRVQPLHPLAADASRSPANPQDTDLVPA
jgi:crossover junction endodeoxyribonuclease RusA